LALGGASAEGFKLDIGASGNLNDVFGVNYGTKAFGATTQPGVDPFINLGYTLKLDADNTLVLGANLDDNVVFLAAKKASKTASAVPGTASTYASNSSTGDDGVVVQSWKFVPSATWKSGLLDTTIQFPAYFNVSSTGSVSDAAMATSGKGVKYLAQWMANKSANTASAANTSVAYNGTSSTLFTTAGRVGYRFVITKEFVVTPVVEGDLALVPFWFADVFTTVSVQTGPVVTDLKASFYNTPNDPQNLDATVGGALVYTYLDPKVTLDFGPFGVKNLKASLAASIPVTTNTDASGKATTLWGTSVTPSVGYKFDAWSFEVSSMCSNVDQGLTGSASSNPPYTNKFEWDPKVKVGYGLTF